MNLTNRIIGALFIGVMTYRFIIIIIGLILLSLAYSVGFLEFIPYIFCLCIYVAGGSDCIDVEGMLYIAFYTCISDGYTGKFV